MSEYFPVFSVVFLQLIAHSPLQLRVFIFPTMETQSVLIPSGSISYSQIHYSKFSKYPTSSRQLSLPKKYRYMLGADFCSLVCLVVLLLILLWERKATLTVQPLPFRLLCSCSHYNTHFYMFTSPVGTHSVLS